MRTILAVLLLIPTLVSAQTFGCYVANYTNYCSSLKANCTFNSALDSLNYGYTVGNLCDTYGYALAKWDEEEKRANHNYSVWEQCAKERDYNAGGWNECAAGWQGTVNLLGQSDRLVKKLRRACGAKCKRIK